MNDIKDLEIGVFLDIDETICFTKHIAEAMHMLGGYAGRMVSHHYFIDHVNKYKQNDPESVDLINNLAKANHCTIIKSRDRSQVYVSKLVPDYPILMTYLNKIAVKVYAFTMGKYLFQRKVLESHGIISEFDGIIGSCQIESNEESIKYPKLKILVDNNFVHTLSNRKKLVELGAVPKDQLHAYYATNLPKDCIFIKSDLYGPYSRVNSCFTIIDEIKKKLEEYVN